MTNKVHEALKEACGEDGHYATAFIPEVGSQVVFSCHDPNEHTEAGRQVRKLTFLLADVLAWEAGRRDKPEWMDGEKKDV